MNIFVAGPRAVSWLNQVVKARLENIMNNNFTISVGDANGIDKQIQIYCHSLGYKKVIVFASNGKVRNNIGNWHVETVSVSSEKKDLTFMLQKMKQWQGKLTMVLYFRTCATTLSKVTYVVKTEVTFF